MRILHGKWLSIVAGAALAAAVTAAGAEQKAPQPAAPVGVVSNIKVLSDKVPDVSSLEAWKKTFIKEGMTDKEKALAVFNTEVTFQQADAPPSEYLQREDAVLDPIKMFNVYGYTLCSVSAANVMCLARYVGLPARGFTINNHVVPEFFYDNAWHMFDADLIEYFPKADGTIASLQEIVDGVEQVEGRASRVRHDQQDEPLRVHGEARLEDRPGDPAAQPVLRRQRLAALRRVRLGRHHAAVRPDRQHLAVVLLDGLPGERAASRGREAHAQLVQQGPAREHEGRRRCTGLAEGQGRRGRVPLLAPVGRHRTRPRRQRHARIRRAAGHRRVPLRGADGREPGRQGRRPGRPGRPRQGRRRARRARHPHAFELRLSRRPAAVHAVVGAGGEIKVLRLRQQRAGLEGRGDGRHGRRTERST